MTNNTHLSRYDRCPVIPIEEDEPEIIEKEFIQYSLSDE